MQRLPQRIASKIGVDPDSGCWLWTASTREGYGQVRDGKRVRGAHVVVFETLVGPVPALHELDHTCHNGTGCPGGPSCQHRRCVNPEHLEPVRHHVNVSRGGLAAANRRRAAA